MNRTLLVLIILFVGILPTNIWAQSSNATLYGVVVDENNQPVEMVNVALKNYPIGTTTNKKGEYLLRIPSGREIVVAFSSIGYEIAEINLNVEEETNIEKNIILQSKSEELGSVTVQGMTQTSGNIVRLNTQQLNQVTGTGLGTVEDGLKTLAGVTSTNEMSSQYSVRGGNFDENLVYVNGIEVYRPYLVRSGQQEGLSFVNTDMVSSIEFSAGGFDAKYGDKMSSVLDIQYNKPKKFGASASMSLLGATAHVENISKNEKFTYNMGLRYKTFRYLMNTLNQTGNYNPLFLDYQGFFTYKISDKLELSFLGTASSNDYNFVPETAESQDGLWNDQRKLTIFFEGQEDDRFRTYTGAFSLNYQPTRNAYLNFTASAFSTNESETFDIVGYYALHEIEDEGTAEQNDSSLNIGLGIFHQHGRNYFNASVLTMQHRGGVKKDDNFIQWGLTYKQEYVNDKMKEWEYRDSAGYSLPYSDSQVQLYYTGKTSYNPSEPEHRFTGFIQDSYRVNTTIGDLLLTGGVRAHYWTYTNNLSVSPRISASLKTGIERDIVTRLSVGMYHQPPFYREIKDFYGNIVSDIQTPRSIHAVAGLDYSFISWDRPFRLTAETYYKALQNLIPYQIDNVRVRYLADQISNGYTYGVDFKVNGEFVSGTQSWISMSYLKTAENIVGDVDSEGNDPGYIRRPNDQRFKFSMYFQDYLPGLPMYQMHLTGHFITGAPFGMPNKPRYQQQFQMRSYRRVDIGFMRLLVSNNKNMTNWKFMDKLQDCSVSLEVFNIIDIENISSYYWITDIYNNTYPMPNNLTGRTLNLKLTATF